MVSQKGKNTAEYNKQSKTWTGFVQRQKCLTLKTYV
jgi:hypothetical protein